MSVHIPPPPLESPALQGFRRSRIAGDLACLCAQEVKDRVNSAVLARVSREVELAEDAADMRFDGLARDEELVADSAVRSPSCHEREDVPFALAQVCERVVGVWCLEELVHEDRF